MSTHIVRQEALNLAVDDEDRIDCPFCGTRERSMKIRRYETGIYYHCFRASCEDGKGFIYSIGRASSGLKKKEPKVHLFMEHTRAMSRTEMHRVCKKYWLDQTTIMKNSVTMTSLDPKRYVFTLYDALGRQWGHATKRVITDDRGLKSVTYSFRQTSGLAWVQPERTRSLNSAIITEGMLDAMKVHKYGQGIALLGTNFNMEMAIEIRNLGFQKIIIALDPDASHVATKIKNSYNLMFASFRIARLSADPKDLPPEQLKEELFQ